MQDKNPEDGGEEIIEFVAAKGEKSTSIVSKDVAYSKKHIVLCVTFLKSCI
jgi:hypothetical protein